MADEKTDNEKLARLEDLIEDKEARQIHKIFGGALLFLTAVGISAAVWHDRLQEWQIMDECEERIEQRVEKVDDGMLLDEFRGRYVQRGGVNYTYDGNHRRMWEIREPDFITERIAKRYNISRQILEAMMIASSHYNPKITEAPSEYRGAVLLDPIRVGITSEVLHEHLELSLEHAARLYKQISEETDDEAKAIAIFFAGEKAVKTAMADELNELYQIRNSQSSYGKFGAMNKFAEKNRERLQNLNWINNIENAWQKEAIYMTLWLMNNPDRLQKFYTVYP